MEIIRNTMPSDLNLIKDFRDKIVRNLEKKTLMRTWFLKLGLS